MVTGTGFAANIRAFVDTTECAATNVTSNSFNFVTPAKAAGYYHVFVYNTDGSSAVKPNGINYYTVGPTPTPIPTPINALNEIFVFHEQLNDKPITILVKKNLKVNCFVEYILASVFCF